MERPGGEENHAAAIQAEAPTLRQIFLPQPPFHRYPCYHLCKLVRRERCSPVPAQPGLQQASLVGRLEGRQSATGQADLLAIPGICWHRKGFQGDVDQLLLLFFVLGQPFGCGRDAGRRTRMKVFQHGQHFGTHTIAAESGIGVARIDPDWQAPLVAEASRVLPAEGEQGAHQGTILGQGPGGPQRGQPAAVAASGEVEQ